jgi:hypothetical protein
MRSSVSLLLSTAVLISPVTRLTSASASSHRLTASSPAIFHTGRRPIGALLPLIARPQLGSTSHHGRVALARSLSWSNGGETLRSS